MSRRGTFLPLRVWTPAPGISKTILSPPEFALASTMACRSDPGPESFVLPTVKVAALDVPDRRSAQIKLDRRARSTTWQSKVPSLHLSWFGYIEPVRERDDIGRRARVARRIVLSRRQESPSEGE